MFESACVAVARLFASLKGVGWDGWGVFRGVVALGCGMRMCGGRIYWNGLCMMGFTVVLGERVGEYFDTEMGQIRTRLADGRGKRYTQATDRVEISLFDFQPLGINGGRIGFR